MNGMIYTFYSYKGGVGRSMALANLGALFFRQGYSTLLVDWDLEAPGLERYFESRYGLDLDEAAARPGVVDLITDYMRLVSEPDPGDGRLPVPDLDDYVVPLERRDGCALSILGAGRRADGAGWRRYAEFVQTFDWTAFYTDWEGGPFLEWFRDGLKQRAEVVLIDSRTGVTEMGGVATQHLADVVVLLCGANLENLVNTARMARNFTSASVREARGDRPLDVLVVPSRVDDSDSEGYRVFLERLDQEFRWLTDASHGEGHSLRELILPYLPAFSYRENLVVGDPEAEKSAERLLTGYWRVRTEMKLLAHDDTALQSGWPRALTRTDPVAYLAFVRDGADTARALADQLAKASIEVRQVDQGSRLDDQEHAADLERASVVVAVVTPGSCRSNGMAHRLSVAEDLGKPIIPVVVGDAKLPLSLSGYHPLTLRLGSVEVTRQTPRLLAAFKALTQPDHEPGGPPEHLICLCYAPEDHDRDVDRVRRKLEDAGYRVWVTHEDLLPGMNKNREVESVLTRARAMVALVTPNLARNGDAIRECTYMRKLGKPLLPAVVRPTLNFPLALSDLERIDLTVNFPEGLRRLLTKLRPFGEGL